MESKGAVGRVANGDEVKSVQVVVHVNGGVVQAVFSNTHGVEVLVVDTDSDGADEADLADVKVRLPNKREIDYSAAWVDGNGCLLMESVEVEARVKTAAQVA